MQRHRNKAGELVEYKAQPRLNFRIGGKPVDKRIPFEREAEARDMVGNYKRFTALASSSWTRSSVSLNHASA